MDLSAGDLIYFSNLVEVPGTPYPRLAADRSIRPLGAEELARQQRTIRDRLAFEGLPPQMTTYDVREFVY